MGWIFEERPRSADFTVDHVGDGDSFTARYVCGRHGDEGYVKAYAIAATPLIFKGLFRKNIDAKAVGGGLWHLEVHYGKTPPPDGTEYRVRYDTTGGTARKTHALEHIESFARSGETAPDHNGAINVVEDGRVEGVDVVIPQFKWTEEHRLSVAVAGWPYSQVLKAITGKVNNATFRGFSAGQVRFDGATGDFSTANEDANTILLTYQFVQQDDVSSVTVGEITGVEKDGWEYAWTEYAQEDDSTAKRLTSQAIAVHVERVYDSADFSLLLLP